MKTPRVRLDMRLIIETDSDRAWRLTIDDADAGVLTATRHGDAVRVELDTALLERTRSGSQYRLVA